MRLATNPKQLPTTTPTLFSCFASFSDVAITSLLVSRPRTISSSFITLAGLKKWCPITCAGRPLAAASSSMSSVDVFDARMASGRVTAAELGERRLLQVHVLEHGLDDDVDVDRSRRRSSSA